MQQIVSHLCQMFLGQTDELMWISPVKLVFFQVTWYFKGRPIHESSDDYEVQQLGNKYALIVKKPTATDAGMYYCEAKNTHGIVRSECHLVIKGNQNGNQIYSTFVSSRYNRRNHY